MALKLKVTLVRSGINRPFDQKDTIRGLGLTRMNIPYLLGTFVTPNREKARLYGFIAHVFNGWAFSILYVFIFQATHRANWRPW